MSSYRYTPAEREYILKHVARLLPTLTEQGLGAASDLLDLMERYSGQESALLASDIEGFVREHPGIRTTVIRMISGALVNAVIAMELEDFAKRANAQTN